MQIIICHYSHSDKWSNKNEYILTMTMKFFFNEIKILMRIENKRGCSSMQYDTQCGISRPSTTRLINAAASNPVRVNVTTGRRAMAAMQFDHNHYQNKYLRYYVNWNVINGIHCLKIGHWMQRYEEMNIKFSSSFNQHKVSVTLAESCELVAHFT